MTDQPERTNREKKVSGRAKRRRYLQGTRAYLHALTNSVAKRGTRPERDDSTAESK